jgi:proline dehydrogenase
VGGPGPRPSSLENMLRSVMLKLAGNRALHRTVYDLGNRYQFTRRFVAGETMQEALDVVRDMNALGVCTSLDLLGEGVADEAEACRATEAYVQLLNSIAMSGVDSNISIKLTQLGLGINRELCRLNLGQIIEKARELKNFVRIDMESSEYTQATLELFEERLPEFVKHVGVVIQSYLYRSDADIKRLAPHGCNIRLCKGAYMEPPSLAYPKKRDVDASYVRLMEHLLLSPSYTAIATHDTRIINHARAFVRDRKIEPDRYEFQMLYGVRREYQLEIVRQGYKMRLYVPYGRHWAPYYMRRLAERPANVLFIAKNFFRK